MRPQLSLLSGLVLALLPVAALADPAPAALKPLQPGDRLHYTGRLVVSARNPIPPEEKGTQYHYVYTVVARTGKQLELREEMTVDGSPNPPQLRTQRVADEAELPPPKAPPGPMGVRQFGVPERNRVGPERITTPAGTFDAVHVVTHIIQISSGTTTDQWYVRGLPLPVKEVSITGAGAVHLQERTLVNIERK